MKTRSLRPIPVSVTTRRTRRSGSTSPQQQPEQQHASEALTLRPFVRTFAEQMERELREHDANKHGWLDVDPYRLLNLMRGEERELDAALLVWQSWRDPAHATEVFSEAADVACYAAMLAHRVGGLILSEPVDERGRALASTPDVAKVTPESA